MFLYSNGKTQNKSVEDLNQVKEDQNSKIIENLIAVHISIFEFEDLIEIIVNY